MSFLTFKVEVKSISIKHVTDSVYWIENSLNEIHGIIAIYSHTLYTINDVGCCVQLYDSRYDGYDKNSMNDSVTYLLNLVDSNLMTRITPHLKYEIASSGLLLVYSEV